LLKNKDSLCWFFLNGEYINIIIIIIIIDKHVSLQNEQKSVKDKLQNKSTVYSLC
jgi:hypothetical protein